MSHYIKWDYARGKKLEKCKGNSLRREKTNRPYYNSTFSLFLKGLLWSEANCVPQNILNVVLIAFLNSEHTKKSQEMTSSLKISYYNYQEHNTRHLLSITFKYLEPIRPCSLIKQWRPTVVPTSMRLLNLRFQSYYHPIK